MEQMLDVALAAKGRGLYPAHLQVRTDMIFIDADSLQMYFVYPPVTGEKDVTDDLFAVSSDTSCRIASPSFRICSVSCPAAIC